MQQLKDKMSGFFNRVRNIGAYSGMDDYEKRRLGIFNFINFFGFLTGLSIPVAGLLNEGYLPPIAWVVATSPAVISGGVLIANYYQRHQFAHLWYFILYPLVTLLVYAGNINVGIEMFFILYAVMAVFFLQKIKSIVLIIALSLSCFICTYLVKWDYEFILSDMNYGFYVSNQLLAIGFIFAAIILIKKENTGYQFDILQRNDILNQKNAEIREQQILIAEKAALLEEQTDQLIELNAIKNRMFSIIGHDLRTPIYGLRNLFKNVQQYDLPGEEIKVLVPDIVNDLNYTTGLMENLLHWSKSQMQGNHVYAEAYDLSVIADEVVQLLRLQAQSKQVHLISNIHERIDIYADKDMISLVLRNLVSNAIKFTGADGEVQIDCDVDEKMVTVHVIDSGVGISQENIGKLFESSYFSTKGTANENGTGLGLMLCRDFIRKNKGDIFVKSKPGYGSIFSFSIPRASGHDKQKAMNSMATGDQV